MNKSWINVVVGVGLVGSMSLSVNSASAETMKDRAKADYINNCAACHGQDGTGNGPMASELKAKPTDLTVITQNNGADFPYLKIRKVIDGSMATGSLRAHGTKEMPVWGDVFRREGGSYSKWTDAQARMMNIVDYLASIQK